MSRSTDEALAELVAVVLGELVAVVIAVERGTDDRA